MERVGWAGINTSRAGAAAIRRGCGCGVERQIERGHDDAQQQPGADPLIEHAGIAADPSDAGACGVAALQDGPGVHIGAGLAVRPESIPQLSGDGLQPWQKFLVIVTAGSHVADLVRTHPGPALAAPGVPGNPAGVSSGRIDGSGRSGVVVDGAYEDGPGPGDGSAQVAAHELPRGVRAHQPVHLAGRAGLHPGRKAAIFFGGVRDGGETGKVEAPRERGGFDPGAVFPRQRHGLSMPRGWLLGSQAQIPCGNDNKKGEATPRIWRRKDS